MTAWPDLLDALEERTRALSRALSADDQDVVVADVELAADGPLPEELRLRALVLLHQTQALEAELHVRQGPRARAVAAYAWH